MLKSKHNGILPALSMNTREERKQRALTGKVCVFHLQNNLEDGYRFCETSYFNCKTKGKTNINSASSPQDE